MSLPQLDFLRFNPTLVRLRLWIPDVGVMGTIVFQSHAGSIEAEVHKRLRKLIVEVSIPRWFD